MDLGVLCDTALHSAWLVPLLVVLIAVDGPVPMLPSETLLMSAAAVAFGEHDVGGVLWLLAAAVVGSAIGDLVVFALGRSSHRVLGQKLDAGLGIAGWVRKHLLERPGVALVGARFVPGGRLVSAAAAGRYGLPLRRFVPWSLVSSAAWGVYMLGIGMALGPLTVGRPLMSLGAGIAMAALTAAGFAIVQRVRRPGLPGVPPALVMKSTGADGGSPVPPAPVTPHNGRRSIEFRSISTRR